MCAFCTIAIFCTLCVILNYIDNHFIINVHILFVILTFLRYFAILFSLSPIHFWEVYLYNMNKNNLETFFTEAVHKDFCILLIDHKKADGTIPPDSIIEYHLEACRNLLEASLVAFHIERVAGRIICYLNYDHSSFSIRTLAGSVRQVLYSLNSDTYIYIFYSPALASGEDAQAELSFILENSFSELILGRRIPISSGYLRRCVEGLERLGGLKFSELSALLSSGSFEIVCSSLNDYADMFTRPGSDAHAYELFSVLDILNICYYAIGLFFADRNYRNALFEQPLSICLVQYNGVAGVFSALCEAITGYSAKFSGVAVSERKQQHVSDMADYIDSHLNTASLSSLSAYFGLTKSYICRLFKTEYHITFNDYLKKKRFSAATEMLRSDSDITISELCEMIGYQSRSHFQNIFKQEFNMTPDEYRKQHHKE